MFLFLQHYDVCASPSFHSGGNFAGVAIDQGIAYILMMAALVLTYLIH